MSGTWPENQDLASMYRGMLEVRLFEEKVGQLWRQGVLPGTVHLYIGEEAVAVGVCANLHRDDYVTSTHRGHAHLLAKGGDMKKMMAELYGKETGYCRAKGGSMHVTATDIGMFGANPVVGAGIPIAAGVALSIKMRNTKQVCVCFFGDAASNQGTFHEGLNFAAIWKLPVIFVCENNMYGVSVHASKSTSVTDIATRAVAYGMPGEVADGMDVTAVYEAAKRAVDRARAGLGPSLIECKTYRYEGHSRGDPAFGVYRSREEVEEWKRKDPINRCRARLIADGRLTDEKDRTMRDQILKEVDEAVKFAEQSPYPDPREALEDLWTPE